MSVVVEVKVPELTKLLLSALKAVMDAPKEWKAEATVTVDELCTAIAEALLPDNEHNEEVCSTGLVLCPECSSCGDAE
jgi:hypothetical protein